MAARSGWSSRAIAGTIGLVFGGLWSLLGATGLPHELQLPTQTVCGIVTASLVAALWLRRSSPTSGAALFRRRGYIIAVVLEIVAIYAASLVLTRYGLESYMIEAVGVIVGLHFIGLWQVTRRSTFLWIAGGICGVSALAACLPDALGGFAPRMMMAGFGNAVILWIGASRD